MNIIDLPIEMILKIIYKLNYIDVLQLYMVSKDFKNIIDKYLYSIYSLLEKNSCELCWHPDYQTANWEEVFNYTIFSNIYVDLIKKKKQALIILKCIHKWLENELIDGPMDRSMIPDSMKKAISIYLYQLFPSKRNEIYDYILSSNNGSHRCFKKIIEKYVSEDLLISINISRIVVDGFSIFETFDFEKPKIMIYNVKFTQKDKYEVTINKYDTKLFNVM